MPDYIKQILAKLSAAVTWMLSGLSAAMSAVLAWLSSLMAATLAWLSSIERLSPAEMLARLSFVDRLVLIVAAIEVVLFVLAILIEFSARKRRRVRGA